MTGVALILSSVALATVLFRTQIEKLLATRHTLLAKISKPVEALTRLILVIVAMREILVR
ncbi:hypothetical protein [Sinorhizobium alkalisoli]|uniref:Uncharacterized protein n=1 Tax=Sinorhizobium alkalisoli TaxID=1752398 RepID=A0A1E3V4D2_9HYPH|nr:hypothetical protein [Sinorhizobium alkalisoli]ODR88482.1 hypothetical protein A8M32_26150 [Sinorhizobium alkalisoli]